MKSDGVHQLLVDAGDFGKSNTESQRLKIEYVLKGKAALGYDAIALGERDLQYGRAFLQKMRDKYGLPFVAANVHLRDTEKLFAEPFVVKRYGDTRIGIFGVTLNEGVDRYVKPETGFRLSDPYAAARGVVDELRNKCDVVIALAHVGLQGARVLAKQVEGIDFIIAGHHSRRLQRPEKIGDTVIMLTGSQGKYLGQIDFRMLSGKPELLEAKTVALSEKIPDDAEMAKLVAEYDKELTLRFPMESAELNRKFTQVSARNCVNCHIKEYLQWRKTAHNQAWASLVADNSHLDASCYQCHTTAFKQPFGFTSVYDTPDLVNVQCVACHQPSSEGVAEHVKRFAGRRLRTNRQANEETNGEVPRDFAPVTEATCTQCHTQEASPGFLFEEALKEVTH